MKTHPNFRVSVEIVLENEGKVFLAKRAANCEVAPGVWCVPAGKAKYTEIPEEAAVRECREEVGIAAMIVKELSRHAATIKVGAEDAYRLFFTYLMRPASVEELKKIHLNDEHSEYAWVGRDDLLSGRYDTLHPSLKEAILEKLF